MQDLRYAFRSLRATPIVSVVAALSLALGIGANTAIFSILNSLMLRSLPVRQPERLALVYQGPDNSDSWTNPIWEQIRDRRELFDGVFAWADTRFDLSKGGQTEFVNGIWASGRFFDVLGVRAMLGRTLTERDDQRGGGPDGAVAVISHDFWRRHFGGAADVVGRAITLDRVSFVIVGVTPPGFYGPTVGLSYDVAIPLGCEPLVMHGDSALDRRSTWWLDIMARLKPGQTFESATNALRGVQPQIRQATLPPDWSAKLLNEYLNERFTLVSSSAGTSYLRLRYGRPLLTIMVVVALVLVIACANIANLLLARAQARRPELGIRVALGASRWKLARLLLAESLLLAGVGAAAGLLVAHWFGRLLVAQISNPRNPVFLDLSLDWRVLSFTAAAGIFTSLLFGIAPALAAGRVQPQQALSLQLRTVAGPGHVRLGNGLVVVQVALSLALVVAGGLFVRTFSNLANLPLGFDRDAVLVVTVDARHSGLERNELGQVFERMRQEAAHMPGVATAALSVVTPVSGSTWQWSVDVEGAVPLAPRQNGIHVNMVSPEWFDTYGTPVVRGRRFAETDRLDAPRVGIVNEAFVRRFLAGANPLGRGVRMAIELRGRDNPRIEIVGLARDAVYRSLRQPVPPTMYVPIAQMDRAEPFVRLSVRSAGPDPAVLVREVATAIGRVNSRFALTSRPVKDYVNASLTQERLIAVVSGCFSALALLLAGLGLYGVAAYAVSRRRAEIGVRLALGAAPAAVVRTVLARVALLVALGVAAGAFASLWAVRFVETLLFGFTAHDPWTFVAAAAILALVGVVAAWLPALRASRIDPATVLREG